MLIETIPAAFEMEEILYELRDHASGLNAGRWDYLFSIIKYFRDAGPDFVLVGPRRHHHDRAVHAGLHRAAGQHLPQARRLRDGRDGGLHPQPRDAEVNARRLRQGHAPTRPARPATASTAPGWPTPTWCRSARRCSTACWATGRTSSTGAATTSRSAPTQLLDVTSAEGANTEQGLRNNLYVAVAYTAVWLSGNGAVAIHNLMEDAATAEISRSQVWQLIANEVHLADTGETVTRDLVARLLDEESERLEGEVDPDVVRAVLPAGEAAGQRLVPER